VKQRLHVVGNRRDVLDRGPIAEVAHELLGIEPALFRELDEPVVDNLESPITCFV